jgi:hypothetical protein
MLPSLNSSLKHDKLNMLCQAQTETIILLLCRQIKKGRIVMDSEGRFSTSHSILLAQHKKELP